MIWQAIEAVVIIFIMVGVGIFISWRKWISRDVAKVFPKLVINLTAPCTLVYSLSTSFSRQQLFDSWLPLLIIFIVVPVTYYIAKLVAIIFKVPKTRQGVFTVLFSFSNSMFVGFPITMALFGESGMPYAIFYYLSSTTFFFLLGFYAISRDADFIKGETSSRISIKDLLKKIISVPIVTILVMFAIVLSGIKLPDTIITAAKYIGDMTTPLSLMFMGSIIYFIGLKGMKFEKGVAVVLFGRYLFVPGFCFAVCLLAISIVSPAGATPDLILMRNVFTVQTGLPVVMMTSIIAELYGADVEYATKNVVWTTIAAVVSIPAYMVLFQYI
ncbi:MAG: AEC family transporter [Christensenellales bacterium]|jgi:predicted permease